MLLLLNLPKSPFRLLSAQPSHDLAPPSSCIPLGAISPLLALPPFSSQTQDVDMDELEDELGLVSDDEQLLDD